MTFKIETLKGSFNQAGVKCVIPHFLPEVLQCQINSPILLTENNKDQIEMSVNKKNIVIANNIDMVNFTTSVKVDMPFHSLQGITVKGSEKNPICIKITNKGDNNYISIGHYQNCISQFNK